MALLLRLRLSHLYGPLLLLLLLLDCGARATQVGFNWGLKSSHPLPADVVVRLLQDNGITKVKLFEADPSAMVALANSGIEVMVGIPNGLLDPLARSVSAAVAWVTSNVSTYISRFGVDIRGVAVGNEPFLETYKDKFAEVMFPALQNVQAALVKAGLGRQVKITVPLNADVYQSSTGLPSGGDFRQDIRPLVVSIARFLLENGNPLTINIYPFLSLYADPHFPIEYAFFDGGGGGAVLVDGAATYTNVFDANFDTLIWALEKNGLASMSVVVGEIGWPTDGDPNANLVNARRFNQGLLDRVAAGKGTPKRPLSPPQIYLFGLLDEDDKNVDVGAFERHWGVFYYDGGIKYPLNLDGAGAGSLAPATGVRYLSRRWCVLSPAAGGGEPAVGPSVDAACSYADCTSLMPGSSCGGLDPRSKISYAFNQYFQESGQVTGSCAFSDLSVITTTDPSQGSCHFRIMVDTSGSQLLLRPPPTSSPSFSSSDELTVRGAPPSLVVAAAALPWILL